MCNKEIKIFRYTCTLLEVFLAFLSLNSVTFTHWKPVTLLQTYPLPQTVTSKNAVSLIRSAWEMILSMD